MARLTEMLIVRAPSAAVNTAIAALARHGAMRTPTRATTEGNAQRLAHVHPWPPLEVVVVPVMVVRSVRARSAAVSTATVVWAHRGAIPTRIRPTTEGGASE